MRIDHILALAVLAVAVIPVGGAAEVAPIFLVSFDVHQNGTVNNVSADITSGEPRIPYKGTGDYAIEMLDADDTVLYNASTHVQFMDAHLWTDPDNITVYNVSRYSARLPYVINVTTIRFTKGDTVLHRVNIPGQVCPAPNSPYAVYCEEHLVSETAGTSGPDDRPSLPMPAPRTLYPIALLVLLGLLAVPVYLYVSRLRNRG